MTVAKQQDEYPGLEKACEFIDACDAAEWEVFWSESAQEDATYVQAERNREIIEISWNGNKFVHALYSHDGSEFRNLRNVADARTRLTGEPLPPSQRGRKPKPKVEVEEENSLNTKIIPRVWPIDFYEADDDDIIDAVRGKTLIWWNRYLVGYDSAQVLPARQYHIHVTESSKGRLIINFVSPAGFRAVAFDVLAQVR